MKRQLPKDIKKAEIEKGYATLINQGIDTYVESYNMNIPSHVADFFAECQKLAQDLDERLKGAFSLSFGGEDFQIRPTGSKGGFKYLIENNDISMKFAPNREWGVVVEYKPAGLWQFGFFELREKVQRILLAETAIKSKEPENQDTWCRVGRLDYCFDFYSPDFTPEMTTQIFDKIICNSATKKNCLVEKVSGWGRKDYLETFTIGTRSSSVQIQIYDKGKEISEKTDKSWFLEVWERNGYYPPDDKKLKDIWRLEIRFKKEFLKSRNSNTFNALMENLQKLVSEALLTRRLSIPDNDSNRSRWKLHPLWAIAYEEMGSPEDYVPIGKRSSLSGQELQTILDAQILGVVRTMQVINIGDFQKDKAEVYLSNLGDRIEADPEHNRKTELARERYKHIGDVRG